MRVLGAVLRNKAIALLVHVLYVVPPGRLVTLAAQLLVKANLAQILNDDVLALDVAIGEQVVVRRAVLAIAETLVLFVFVGAARTGPRDDLRREADVVAQLVSVLVEFLDEIEREQVVAAVPQLHVRVVVRVRERELR